MRRNTNQESGIDLSTEESIQPLTSEYAKLRFNKKGLVVGALVVVVALALMMGFMIASVVIGVNITKEVGIRNGALVPYRGNQVALKTSTMMYEQPLTLFSPLSVIESTKSITVNIKEGAFSGQFQFEVVSFVYVKGVQLVFYGHTHMASILGDGSVQLEPLVPFDGAKRDGSTTQTTGSATTISTAGGSSDVITLSTCSALTGATDASAQYALGADLNCALSGPLFNGQVFTGNFNGNGNTLTVQVASSGSVGLFAAVQGTVQRLVLSGTFSGAGVCGGFTARALAGSLFSAVSFTGSVQCGADASGSVSVGGFAGVLESSSLSTSAVSFRGAISQGSQSSSAASGTANIGGFFGSAVSASASFSDSYVDSAISQTSANSAAKIDLVGNSATAGANCPSQVVAIVDNGSAPSETCLSSVERCPNLPDSNNCGPSICFGCRDTSLDRSLRPAVRPLTTPNFSPSTGNLRFF